MHPTDLVALLAEVPTAAPPQEPQAAELGDILERLLTGEMTTTEALMPAVNETLHTLLQSVAERGTMTPTSHQEGANLCRRLRSLPPISAACAW
jgi:hypothetical protein